MKLTLKQKIVLISTSSVLVLGAVCLILLKQLSSKVEWQAETKITNYAQALALAIEAQYFERYADIQAFAMNPVFQGKNQDEKIDYLNKYTILYAIYDLILLVDTKGNLIATNNVAPNGESIKVDSLYSKNFSEEPWFQAVMNESYTADKERNFNGTFVEQPHFDPYVTSVWGEKRYGNSFSAPVKNAKGETIAVMTNRAGMRWYFLEFENAHKDLKSAGLGSSKLFMVDKEGKLFDFIGVEEDKEKFLGEFKFSEYFNGDAAKLLTRNSGFELHEVGEKMVSGTYNLESPKFTPALGWKIMIQTPFKEAMGAVLTTQRFFWGSVIVCTLTFIFIGLVFSSRISNALSKIIDSLNQSGTSLSNSSTELRDVSVGLAEASNEQSAAVHETASALAEVSSMIERNSSHASKSMEVSNTTLQDAKAGQENVQEMLTKIEEIHESNKVLAQQIEEGNVRFAEIINVISEIGQKTKVINDIVFQTKLLSFNASVEAARAGEHGKGFAVVAEEVGNLAQMSGSAAKEITQMLDTNISKAQGILQSNKEGIFKSMELSRQKVDQGVQVANRCLESLSHIYDSISQMDTMIKEIATASKEQATGIGEINKAVQQINESTRRISQSSQSNENQASHVVKSSNELAQIVGSLNEVVTGHASPKQNLKTRSTSSHKTQLQKKSPEPLPSNVVTFKSNPSKASGPAPSQSSEVTKVAVGSELIPSANDPRFEEEI